MAEIEEIKKKSPVTPSYKTRLLTNEVVTKKNMAKEIKIFYKHKQLHMYNKSLALK